MKRHRGTFKCILLSEKKPIWKGYIDSNYMIFWQKQDYGNNKNIGGHQGLGRREGWIEYQGFTGDF